LNGALRLVCAPGCGGRAALVGQYVSAPMHVSKPWWDERLMVVNAINSTAGIFSGDVIEASIEVKRGAELLVTSPSASRAHRMISGEARVVQRIHVEEDAWLEMLPGLFIPHAGSNYRQETVVRLEAGARFLWSETVAPGRVASGEAWQFTGYRSAFSLSVDGRMMARENYRIDGSAATVGALRRVFANACHGTCYAVGGDFSDGLLRGISAVHHAECWVGSTRLDGAGICVRMVAADNLHLARAMGAAREMLHGAFSRKVPAARRA
jgi:urease accessory protein